VARPKMLLAVGGGAAYVTGKPQSSDFSAAPGAFDATINGNRDAFVAKVNPAGSALLYGTSLGGSDYDRGGAVAVDGRGAAYVTGYTESSDFPAALGAFDSTYNGSDYDAFVAKLAVGDGRTCTISGRVLDGSANPIAGAIISASGGYTATTDADGRYTLGDLMAGTYTVAPSKSDYVFSPSSYTVSVPPAATQVDFTAFPCMAPSGLDVCRLRLGDILVKRGSMDAQCAGAEGREWIQTVGGTYFTHSALYVGDLKIAEAAGSVKCDPLDPCDRSEEVRETGLSGTQFWSGECVTDWAVLRPEASDDQKQTAIGYALAKAQEEGVVFDIKAARDNDMRFYCAKFVWRTYQEAGVEVEAESQLCRLDLGYFVTPDELYFGSPAVQELSPTRTDRLKAIICSPGHLAVVDSRGKRAGFDPTTGQFLHEIPGAIVSGDDAIVETITLLGPVDGVRVLVSGFDTGPYSLVVENVDDELAWTSQVSGATYPGKEEWFAVQPARNGNGEGVVTPLVTYLPLAVRHR